MGFSGDLHPNFIMLSFTEVLTRFNVGHGGRLEIGLWFIYRIFESLKRVEAVLWQKY